MSCLMPISIKNPSTGVFVSIECGKCYECKQKVINQYVFKLEQEAKKNQWAYFVTMTYDNQHVPFSPNGFMTLDTSKHIRNYFRSLRNHYRYRKKNPDTGRTKYYYDKVPKISYLIAGEYGGSRTYGRPHYHAVILGVPKDVLEKYWYHGNIQVDVVNTARMYYTIKYIDKPSKVPLHSNDDRVKEFRRASNNLGESYLTELVKQYHKDNEDISLIISGKYKVGMPKKWKSIIWPEKHVLEQIHNRITEKAQNILDIKEKEYRIANKIPELIKLEKDETIDKEDYFTDQRRQSNHRLKRSQKGAQSNRKFSGEA